ncbi:hypothetical protein ACHAWO_002757 [Cyclotella atomus]|uniref:Uncharacterized protein n=1 Tax=Cyclotella atomus TaxID=382360 RepID=A0ABD3QNJ8_9STRA
MSPAKKRRVLAKQAADALAHDDGAMDLDAPSNADIMPKLQKCHTDTMLNLQSNLDLLQKAPAGPERDELIFSCSVALSTLKLLQRQISLQIDNHHATVAQEERVKVEACSLMLQNLNYERNYLRREIDEFKGWKAEDLEKMAADELGMDLVTLGQDEEKADGDVHMDDEKKINSPEEAIDAYFFGDAQHSHRDPANHESMLTKLQEDKDERSSLVEELSKSKLELKELQRKREQLRNFLTQIPKKPSEMEKVGESLSGFFKGCKAEWLCSDEAGAEKKLELAKTLACPPSLKRTDRFQLAQSKLASPLYTLFFQIAGYIDAWSTLDHLDKEERDACNLEELIGADGMSVSAIPSKNAEEEGNQTWDVELSISTVNIIPAEIATMMGRSSKAGGDTLKIVFSYDADQGVVTSHAVNENDSASDDDILDNLFPGDDGSISPDIPTVLMKSEEEVEASDPDAMQGSDVVKSPGKPYHWCQVISGLNLPPPFSRESTGASFQVNACTKAVFRQLIRRIRARKSLGALLEVLSRRQNLPIHPAFRAEETSTSFASKAKVVSWSEEKDNHQVSLSPSMKRFVATIKRKTSTLKAAVIIDMQNYPSEPPIWSLQSEDGTITGSALSLGEQSGELTSLNNSNSGNKAPPLFDATLHRIENHVNTDLDQFVNQDVEATYDWILMHQLADIVSCWDEMMSSVEGNGGAKTKDFELRRVKGKDRQLLGLGENSPFFYYRQRL